MPVHPTRGQDRRAEARLPAGSRGPAARRIGGTKGALFLSKGQFVTTVRKKILCIEDDRECAALIAEELLDQGFEVDIAHDGYQGLVAIENDKPDLVLCDIDVRPISGFEVLKRLTAIEPRLGNLPFVFMTSLADRYNEFKGRQLGIDQYVTKPIDFDVLVAIINARLAGVARTIPPSNPGKRADG